MSYKNLQMIFSVILIKFIRVVLISILPKILWWGSTIFFYQLWPHPKISSWNLSSWIHLKFCPSIVLTGINVKSQRIDDFSRNLYSFEMVWRQQQLVYWVSYAPSSFTLASFEVPTHNTIHFCSKFSTKSPK